MEQHAVPQHIASFEFKLFGNLTMRQFVSLAIPLGIAALIFFSSLPAVLRFGLSGLIASVGGFVALVPYNGRPLDKWVVVFIKAITNPTQRIWLKENRIPDFLDIILEEPVVRHENEQEITRKDREELFKYLRSIPQGKVSPLDVREDLALTRLGLSEEGAQKGKLPIPIFWGARAGEKPEEEEEKKTKPKVEYVGEIKHETKKPAIVVLEQKVAKIPVSLAPTRTAGMGVRISPHAKPFALVGLEKRLHAEEKRVNEQESEVPRLQLASEANFTTENIIPITTSTRQVRLVHGIAKTRARKLHFAPPKGFDLSDLPVRGEARFEISQELKRRYEKEEEDKMRVVNDEINQPDVKKKPDGLNFGDIFKTAVSGAKSAAGNIIRHTDAATVKTAKNLKKPDVISKALSGSFPTVSQKPQEREKVDSQVSVVPKKVVVKPNDAASLARAQMLPLTDKANVISGLISDVDGVPIEGLIVIVRDGNGIPLRALKTNKLGQFLSVTPLPDGSYTLEMEGSEKAIDPVSIVLSGEIIQPLMIQAAT